MLKIQQPFSICVADLCVGVYVTTREKRGGGGDDRNKQTSWNFSTMGGKHNERGGERKDFSLFK
jgi:hypothetical protein